VEGVAQLPFANYTGEVGRHPDAEDPGGRLTDKIGRIHLGLNSIVYTSCGFFDSTEMNNKNPLDYQQVI
jgi:hypothetical protein